MTCRPAVSAFSGKELANRLYTMEQTVLAGRLSGINRSGR